MTVSDISRAASVARIRKDLEELVLLPGLSGYEGRVRARIRRELEAHGLSYRTDTLGNLIATLPGDLDAPSVMLFTHMDQLGFVVRKIEPDGFVRIERVGGVPEKALPSQAVLFQIGEDRDLHGVIANKSHHATLPDEKYRVVPYRELYIDTGLDNAEAVHAAGIKIGTPVVYKPNFVPLEGRRVAGTAIDDRAGCAVLIEVMRHLKDMKKRPTVHLVFSVQEEFNLRGAVTAAQVLTPDIAIQIDLMLAADTPDMRAYGDVRLGAGPGIGMYSFHGRGTLNGTIPHPALVALFETTSVENGVPLQRNVHFGALTETSYVQLVGGGIAVVDLGFPCRYSHSSLEVCDLDDLAALAALLSEGIGAIGPEFSLDRDEFEQ